MLAQPAPLSPVIGAGPSISPVRNDEVIRSAAGGVRYCARGWKDQGE
jgi:hypothetical protein